MSFSISTLRTILQIRFGISPWAVTLCTDFRLHLHLTDREIREVLADITVHTGMQFPPDTVENLTDVFDLLIHVILRLHEDFDTAKYFGPIPDKLYERLSVNNYAMTLGAYATAHLN